MMTNKGNGWTSLSILECMQTLVHMYAKMEGY